MKALLTHSEEEKFSQDFEKSGKTYAQFADDNYYQVENLQILW